MFEERARAIFLTNRNIKNSRGQRSVMYVILRSMVYVVIVTHVSVILWLIPCAARVNLPRIPGVSIRAGSGSSMAMNDTAVDTIIFAVDSEGQVVDEIVGVMMEF